jgi:CRISPR-associated endonuclease/helicase Cas3
MGRCYRKRDLIDDSVNVAIFTRNPSGVGTIIDRDIFQLSLAALVPFHNKRISEKEKLAVVRDVYSLEKIRDTDYYKGIKVRLEFLEKIPAYEFERKEVDEKFRNIRSHTVIPGAVYEKNKTLIHDTIQIMSELGFSDEDRAERIKRHEALKELTVDVPHYMCMAKNVLTQVMVDRKNTIKIVNLGYSSRIGLTAKPHISNFV